MADWLKASDEDLELLGFEGVTFANASGLAAHWVAHGCSRVALTFGAQGAYVQVGTAHAQDAAPSVSVVDTVGAGDTFWGSCLADWVVHDTLAKPDVAEQRLATTLQRALQAAAINCSRTGCQPPTAAELSPTLR
jgi:fructokinase